MMYRTGLRCLLLSSAALTPALPAAAQTEFSLGTIVVESKREVQTDTATAETVVDLDEIEDRQAGTIAELVDSVPGVNLVNGGSPVGSGINVRGFGATGTYGTDQKVGIQVGGATKGSEELYRIGTQLFTDPDLYREAVVLRGMGGTFEFGSGYFGGLLRLEPIQAADLTGGAPGFAFKETLQYSSNGDGLASSSTAAWQPTENFEVLGNYTWRKQGVQDDGDGTPRSEDGYTLPSWLLNSRLTFGETGAHSLSLLLSRTETDRSDVPYDSFGTTGDQFGNVDRATEDSTAVLGYAYDAPGTDLIDLEVDLSYSDQKIEQEYVPGSSICEVVDCGFPFPPGGFPTVNADHRYETTKLTAKNTALFDTGAVSHDLRIGAEYIRRERKEASAAPGGTEDRVALFAVDDMRMGRLTVTPQLRYETQEIGGDGYDDYDNSALMGGVSARYAFSGGLSVLGGAYYNENLPILDDLGTPAFMTEPEKATTFEAGLSFDGRDLLAAGDALALKAMAYDTHYWSVSSYSSGGAHYSQVDLSGLELEAAYSLANGVYVDLNANIARGEGVLPGAGKSDWEGIPADQLRMTLGKRWGETLDLSWEVVTDAEMTRSATPSPSFTVHNLRATYRPQSGVLEDTELRVGLENLTDEYYTPHLATRPAPGRNLKLTLSKTF